MTLRDLDPKPGDKITIHRTVVVSKIDERGAMWTEDGICYGLDKEYFSGEVIERAEPEVPEYWPPQPGDVWMTGDDIFFACDDYLTDEVYLVTPNNIVHYKPESILENVGWPELMFRYEAACDRIGGCLKKIGFSNCKCDHREPEA